MLTQKVFLLSTCSDGFLIDFYFCENGEINGFDPWRLAEFSRKSRMKTNLDSEHIIKQLVDEEVRGGSIYKSNRNNYYVIS